MESRKIAVIGAGLCGLTAARRLHDAGHRVRVFDKSRGTGGRLATRRSARGAFDHGAPVVQVNGEDFERQLVALNATRTEEGFIATPGMSGLVKPLARGLDILCSTEIASLRQNLREWTLTDITGARYDGFSAVVLAIPAPQLLRLVRPIAPKLATHVASVKMLPIWTCMMAFEKPLHLPDTVCDRGVVERADRCNAKPGRDDDVERWVVHFTPAYSRQHLDRDLDLIGPDLLEAFEVATDLDLPRPVHLSAHRWRYAYVDTPLGEPFIGDPARGLYVGGDWTLGRRAEDAWRSGQALGDALAEMAVPA